MAMGKSFTDIAIAVVVIILALVAYKVSGEYTWFNNVFGFAEKDYAATQQMFVYDATAGTVKSKKSDRLFQAGKFETPSLEDLRARVDLNAAKVALGNRSIQVTEDYGDVSAFHTMPENEGALFQAASQFNGLEHVNEHGKPEWGISCYSSDRTQGPACATACAPGTIVRNYFAFGSNDGQTGQRQVRNLGQVEELLANENHKYFEVQSGYTMASRDGLQRLGTALQGNDDLQEEVRKKLRIAVQQDTEVVASGFGSNIYSGPKQLVTQAYCSAVSVSYSGQTPSAWAPFATLILDAAYEATIYAAVENFLRNPDKPGSRKVFLTALGGGVFGNDMGWIKNAMDKAFQKFRDVGLEVYMVSYSGSTPIFKELERTAQQNNVETSSMSTEL